MDTFKRQDYIYLEIIEDYKDKVGIEYKKGEILRYKKEWLIENIVGRQFTNIFGYHDDLIYEKNDTCDENDILYHKIYKSITVSKNKNCTLYLWPGDYFYFNDWLYEHIDDKGIYTITNAQKNFISDKLNDNKLIKLPEKHLDKELEVHIYFRKNEKLDFSNPAVIALFYDAEWMKLFSKTKIISGKKKQELFDEDFSNAIYAQEPITTSIWKNNPNYDLHEYHYFKIKDDIQAKTKDEIQNKIGIEIPYDVNFAYDDEGFIKWVFTDTSCYDNSCRDTEQLILKFADRISINEAYEYHKKLIADYIKQQEIQHIKIGKEMLEKKLELQKLYEPVKNNPLFFPGVHGYFVHNDNENKSLKKEKHTLHQVKEFYQKLKTLDPSVVKEMCFYGGTIPYILNNANESRDFGDIDIFVSISQMEKLRDELMKQNDFEMIYDSKPLAQFCDLTSRISKKATPFVNRNKQNNESLELTPKENMTNINQIVYGSFKDYYNKTQDFGFKAKLFGINISVFPIYQYKNHIMAKSFNINDKHKFLLGIKVLNNTTIEDFTKHVKLYGSVFKILPLEYTLVSKKSAVDEQNSFRLEKDKEDVEYILLHQKELKIEDKKIQDILSKYPDYSISIAYRVNDNGTTSTLGGSTYKELILTNRHIS